MLASACAELSRWVSVLTATGITEAVAKLDYVTKNRAMYVRLCVGWYHTQSIAFRISGGQC